MAGAGDPLRVKGSYLVQIRNWLEKNVGTGYYAATLREVTAPSEFEEPLVAIWYDADVVLKVLQLAARRTSHPLEEVCREISIMSARHDLTTIYRIFLGVAGPQNVLRFGPQLWKTYVSFGKTEVVRNEPGDFVGRCRELPARFQQWVTGVWLGFVPTAVEVAGGKAVEGKVVNCVIEPDKTCSLEFAVRYHR